MPRKNSIAGFPRNIFFIGLVSLFTDISSEMIYPLLPVFLTAVLGAPVSFVGIVEGIAESTASLMKLVVGRISDRVNRRKVFVVAGYTLSSVARPLVALAAYPWHVLAVRFADRLGKGIRTAPRDALIADTCDPAATGKAFGFHRAMDHLGAVIGPAIAAVLLAWFTQDYRLVFAAALIPALLAVLVVVFLVQERPRQAASRQQSVPLRWGMFDANFRKYLLVIVLFTLGNSSDAFLLLRAKDAGVAVAALPLLWIVLHLVKTASSTHGGMLSDLLGRRKVIIAGWILYAAVYVGFAVARLPLHIWLLFAVYGCFFGLTEAAEKALVADLVPAELRGSAYGMYHCAIGIAALPSSILMGWLWQRFGVITAFSCGAGCAVVAAAALVLLVRESPR